MWKSVKVSKSEVWDSKDLGDKRRMNFKFCTEAKNHLKYRGHESWVRFIDFEILLEKSTFLIQPGDASCHVLSSKDGSLVDLNYDELSNVQMI